MSSLRPDDPPPDPPTPDATEGGAGSGTGSAGEPRPPFLRVVRGEPTDAELAAVIAVLAAAGGPPAPEPALRSRWAAREALVRRVPTPGPGAWRASAGPR